MEQRGSQAADIAAMDSNSGELTTSHEVLAAEIYKKAKDLYDLAISQWCAQMPEGWRILEVSASIHDVPLFDFSAGLDYFPKNYIDEQPDRIMISLSGKERVQGKDIPLVASNVTFDANGLVSIDYLPEEYDQVTNEMAHRSVIELHHRILTMMTEASEESLRFQVTFFGSPQPDSGYLDTSGQESAENAALPNQF